MANIFTGWDEFEGKFNRLKHSRNIFLFLLYSSSEGQKAVGRFIEEHFMYLHELAEASQTFIFLFTRSEMGRDASPNPGLQVARTFQIRPNELPGVLVFCLASDDESFGDGAYMPLNETLFQDNPKAIEGAFADLFSMIQETAESDETPQEQIASLRRMIGKQQRAQAMRPFISALKTGTISVIRYTGKLVYAMAPAWHM